MNMSHFWSQVGDIKSLTELQAAVGEDKLADLLDRVDMLVFSKNTSVAYDVIPNLGPGGPTSDEDEIHFADAEDDNDDVGPSLGGEKTWMVYLPNIDELWCLGRDGDWALWNY